MLRLAQANMYLQLGIRAKQQKLFAAADKHLQLVLNLIANDSSAFANQLAFEANHKLASIRFNDSKFQEAVSHYQRAIETRREVVESDEQKLELMTSMVGLGRTYTKLGDEAAASKCFSEVEKILETLPTGANNVHILVAIAEYQGSIHSPALEATQRKIEIARALRNPKRNGRHKHGS